MNESLNDIEALRASYEPPKAEIVSFDGEYLFFSSVE